MKKEEILTLTLKVGQCLVITRVGDKRQNLYDDKVLMGFRTTRVYMTMDSYPF